MEMETPHGGSLDSFGKMIGIQTALLAVFLSIFSILAHQTDTESIILVNESSDQWSYYQAKRIREYQLELNVRLLQLMAPVNEQTTKTITQYVAQEKKYNQETDDIKSKADKIEQEGKFTHRKTDYFELAEGLLEIAMILSSLYFLSHKKIFPMLGLLLGMTGCIIGVLGLLLH